MLSVLPVTDDQTWLNKLRPEFRDNINHPTDPANTTPANNPRTSPKTTEDRRDVGDMSPDYHRVGRTLLSAAVDFDLQLEFAFKRRAPRIYDTARILKPNPSIYRSWNSDNSATPD
jgi:hypothetical protein